MVFHYCFKKRQLLFMLLFLALIGVPACTAPNDVDTPRKVQRSGDEERVVFTIQNAEVAFRPLSAALPLPYTCIWQRAEVDTTGSGVLYLHGTCTAITGGSPAVQLPLKVLTLHCEKLPLAGSSIPIFGDRGATKGTTITVSSLITSNEMEITPDGGASAMELRSVILSKQTRSIQADIHVTTPVDGRPMEIEGTLAITY